MTLFIDEDLGIKRVSVPEHNTDMFYKYKVKFVSKVERESNLYFNSLSREFDKARKEYEKEIYDFVVEATNYETGYEDSRFLTDEEMMEKCKKIVNGIFDKYAVYYDFS